MHTTWGYYFFFLHIQSCRLPIHRPNKGMRQNNMLYAWNTIVCRVGTLLVTANAMHNNRSLVCAITRQVFNLSSPCSELDRQEPCAVLRVVGWWSLQLGPIRYRFNHPEIDRWLKINCCTVLALCEKVWNASGILYHVRHMFVIKNKYNYVQHRS